MKRFKVTPGKEVQRKIDFFITPYNLKINIERAMRFAFDESSKQEKIEDSDRFNWGKFTEMIMNYNEESLGYLVRHKIISEKQCEDFITKLDLIETHRGLFENTNVLKQFSKEEIELLRILITTSQPKQYAHKSPNKSILQLIRDQKQLDKQTYDTLLTSKDHLNPHSPPSPLRPHDLRPTSSVLSPARSPSPPGTQLKNYLGVKQAASRSVMSV